MQTLNHFPRSFLTIALAGLGLGAQAHASDESIYFSELPVVASVSRLPQRLADAPTAVTVIDREMIRASGARDLNDIFRLVPGFQTYPNTTEAGRVAYHGLNDDDFSPRLQVLVDGRSMHSPLFSNGVNWATIPVALEDIEQIEIVRGTNTVSYGTNAFLGVINIVTVDPSLARGFSVATSYGNQNVRDYSLRAGGRLGEAGDIRFTYKHQNDDGLSNRDDWVDSYGSRLLDLRADFAIGDRDSLQLSAGQVRGVTQVGRLDGGTILGQPTNPVRNMRQTNHYAQFLWRHVLSASSDFQVRYSYSVDRATDAFDFRVGPLTYTIDQAGGEGIRHELEMQHSLQFHPTSRVVWGASWRDDSMRSDWILPGQGSVHREVGRVFGNLEWKPNHWFTGNAGLSGENDTLAGFHPSPRLSANFHLNPQNTFRLGYSRAYRTGSIADYRGNWWNYPAWAIGYGFHPNYHFLADREMSSERMDTYEIGYLGDWRDWRASLDVRLFSEKIDNRLLRVDLDPSSAFVLDSVIPVQDVHIRGVEYQFKWQPFEGTRLMLNQAFVRIAGEPVASAQISPTDNARLDELSERSMPRRSTSALLMQKLPWGLDFSLAGYWQDKMKWSLNTWAGKYHRFDARLAYPFRTGKLGGELALTVQSLNGDHGEYKAYGDVADRVVERRQWVSLRLDY